MIHVVAGLIINSQKKILVSFRRAHVPQGNLWEFPGGKVETGETPYEALVRELREEINIDVIAAEPFFTTQHAYDDRHIHLDVWKITEYRGEPHGLEGQQIRWVSAEELSFLTFPAANQAIVKDVQKYLTKCD